MADSAMMRYGSVIGARSR